MLQWIISSSVLIAVILLLRLLLKGRISLRLQYGLWALVLLRLLLPFTIGSSPISVSNFAPTEAQTPPPVVAVDQESADQDQTPIVVPDQNRQPQVEDQIPQNQTPVTQQPDTQQPITQQPVTQAPTEPATADTPNEIDLSAAEILRILRVVGSVAVGIWFAAVNLRMHRKLRASRRPVEVENCSLPVYVSDRVDTPCLFGLFRPAIYLTEDCLEDESTLRYAIVHEQTHYRHLDFLWALLRCLCLALHWYNPLVWWAALASQKDAELACDESVLRRLGDSDRAPYGRALLRLTCEKRPRLLSVSTTMTGSAKNIKERITMIVKKPKMAIYTLVAVLLITAIAIGCTFTGAEKDATDDSQITTPQEAVYALYEAAGEMTLSIQLSDGTFTEPHKLDLRWYAEELAGRINLYGWTQIDTVEENKEKIYAVLSSPDGERKLSFSHENLICYESGETTLCWQTEPDAAYRFVESTYGFYKNLSDGYTSINLVAPEVTAEEAVTDYVEKKFEETLLSAIRTLEGQPEDYTLIDYSVEEISGDGREAAGYVVYAVSADLPYAADLWGYGIAFGIGEYEGMTVFYERFLLHQHEGSWYHVGTRRCYPLSELPEDQTICQAGDPSKPYISKLENGVYTLSDLDGTVLFEMSYVRWRPEEICLTESIYQITHQAGTGLSTNWAVFYDGESNRISETFQHVLGAKDQYVVYSQSEGDVHYIIVQDIFDPAAYKKTYEGLDPSTMVADCIMGIEYDPDGNMVVRYLSGENNEEAVFPVELPGLYPDLPVGSDAVKYTPQAALLELFDVKGEMSICLELAGSGRSQAFLLQESRYAEWYSGYISNFDWTAAEASAAVNEDYCMVLQSTDGAHQMKIYSQEIQYTNGDENFIWQGTPKDKNCTSVAGEIRREYDSMEELYVGHEWTCAIEGSAEEAVQIYAEQYFTQTVLKPLTLGSIYAITDCQVIDWTIFSVSEDGNSVQFEVSYAFMPANTDPDNNPLAAGGVEIDREAYGGMWTTYTMCTLYRAPDGLWHPDIHGDEGGETPAQAPTTPQEAFDLVYGEKQSLRMYLRLDNGEISPVLRTSAPAYYEIFTDIMGEDTWEVADPDSFSTGDYTVVLLSEDGRHMLSASGNALLYESEGLCLCWSAAENAWWRAENTVEEYLRNRVFNNEEFAYDRISFYCEGTAEDAARRFAEEEFAKLYLNLTEGHLFAYSDYKLMEWETIEVSEDGNTILFWFTHAFVPANSPLDQMIIGNGGLGTGEYEGMVWTYRQVILQKKSNGKWYCIGIDTGITGL